MKHLNFTVQQLLFQAPATCRHKGGTILSHTFHRCYHPKKSPKQYHPDYPGLQGCQPRPGDRVPDHLQQLPKQDQTAMAGVRPVAPLTPSPSPPLLFHKKYPVLRVKASTGYSPSPPSFFSYKKNRYNKKFRCGVYRP